MESDEAVRVSPTHSRVVSCPVSEVLFQSARQRTVAFQPFAQTLKRCVPYAFFVLHRNRLPRSAVQEVDSRGTLLLTWSRDILPECGKPAEFETVL